MPTLEKENINRNKETPTPQTLEIKKADKRMQESLDSLNKSVKSSVEKNTLKTHKLYIYNGWCSV